MLESSSTRPLDDLEDVAIGALEEEALVGGLSQRLDEDGSVILQALPESREVIKVMKEGDMAAELSFMF